MTLFQSSIKPYWMPLPLVCLVKPMSFSLNPCFHSEWVAIMSGPAQSSLLIPVDWLGTSAYSPRAGPGGPRALDPTPASIKAKT